MSLSIPRLPAEIVALIVELAILTSSPCPRTAIPRASTSDSSEDAGSTSATASPFNRPLRAAYASAWSWTAQLLYVSKFVHAVARPLLVRTLTLDTPRAALAFFASPHSAEISRVERAWLGNVSALARGGVRVDPLALRLAEAAWYEECSGGFVVGHAYASRAKQRRKRSGKGRQKRYRSVSVYWAEEQLVEEVSDPDRSSDGTGDSEGEAEEAGGAAQSLPLPSTDFGVRQGQQAVSQRRSSHQEGSGRGDPRVERPHEPAWQTLYSRRRRSSPMRSRVPDAAPSSLGASSTLGPSEGDLDPWDMQDAQERLAALANADPTTHEAPHDPIEPEVQPTPPPALAQPTPPPRTEIYAYHLCTATLEAWINPLLASLRTLRLVTLTFYPGHLLDDDKLEHMLRRLLSRAENPRLEVLLIRIVFDAASAGSRMRRFERTKTIAGAVERVGDERVRVMLVNARAGEGELVRVGEGEGVWSAGSRRAIALTKDGWWARVLQANHGRGVHLRQKVGGAGEADAVHEHERQLSDWSMFFPPSQHANPTHLVNLLHHCDPWPDCPNPVT
ncbi:conserved hypothetical protein [Sporisorium reilianum SRZ2]|uniref:Uncharacterized protein n=1 Tax=Sporisorium reilianum (strain SRZ2) TaxID=999809 RepID=E6ZWS6_SPORE|nr:conserved hypothetical protein [Sporisorium reilianum SRZ2]